jgi:predicted transcriptional regulator
MTIHMADPSSSRRRARCNITVDILKSANDGEKKTRIMQKAQLSFHQLEKYLDALNHAGFIIEESGIWKTTKKGLHVIEACELCLRLTREI